MLVSVGKRSTRVSWPLGFLFVKFQQPPLFIPPLFIHVLKPQRYYLAHRLDTKTLEMLALNFKMPKTYILLKYVNKIISKTDIEGTSVFVYGIPHCWDTLCGSSASLAISLFTVDRISSSKRSLGFFMSASEGGSPCSLPTITFHVQ